MKGRDPAAQVSSSSPGQGGWGPGLPAQVSVPLVTSGHPQPPLRSRPRPSRSQRPRGRAPDALHILRFAAPVRSHLPPRRRVCSHNLCLAPQSTADSPGYFGSFQHPVPPPFVWVGSRRAPEGTARASQIAFVGQQSSGRNLLPLRWAPCSARGAICVSFG